MTIRNPLVFVLSVVWLAVLLAFPARAAEPDITLSLSEEGCAGALPGQTCVVSFQVNGAPAKILYDHMQAKAVKQGKEECLVGLVKTDKSGLICAKQEDGYYCDFGYRFKTGKMARSEVPC